MSDRKFSRSLSQLKAYTRCGQLFYLERIRRKDVPRRPAAWTILGVTLHETIMEWEKSGRTIDSSAYFDVCYDQMVNEEWERQPDQDLWIVPPRTKTVQTSIKNYKQRGFDQIPVYEEYCRSAPWEISNIEREFEIDLDGVIVKGALDRTLYWPADDSYTLEDLKTGSPKDEDDPRQLGFYAMVARELWDIPVNEGRYWYTKLDRGSSFHDLTRYDKKFWAEEFRQLDLGVSSGVFLASPGDACGICSVKPWCSTMGWLKVGDPLK